eukprot:TRINITY_DN12781_c0_g1_i1.p1 TRINITY_DN12781_c0_g1~~TRINITY_DN12781_c0_g1_i1.p1  ORF type:complete len:212 (-),score=38.83 TRINITY_DN12781_c0_g1_i1:12-647(-)
MKSVIFVCLLLVAVASGYYAGPGNFGTPRQINDTGSFCSYLQYTNYTTCGGQNYPGDSSCVGVTNINSTNNANPCNYQTNTRVCVSGYNVTTPVDVGLSAYALTLAQQTQCFNDTNRNQACPCRATACIPTCTEDPTFNTGTYNSELFATPDRKYCYSRCTSCDFAQRTVNYCNSNCGRAADLYYCANYAFACCGGSSSSSTLSSWLGLLF